MRLVSDVPPTHRIWGSLGFGKRFQRSVDHPANKSFLSSDFDTPHAKIAVTTAIPASQNPISVPCKVAAPRWSRRLN
jgi:hypothetical protein